MHKLPSHPDGASMSRKFAPDLVTSDAHAAKKMSSSGYGNGGNGGNPPTSKNKSGNDDYEPKPKKSHYKSHGYGDSTASDYQEKSWKQHKDDKDSGKESPHKGIKKENPHKDTKKENPYNKPPKFNKKDKY